MVVATPPTPPLPSGAVAVRFLSASPPNGPTDKPPSPDYTRASLFIYEQKTKTYYKKRCNNKKQQNYDNGK